MGKSIRISSTLFIFFLLVIPFVNISLAVLPRFSSHLIESTNPVVNQSNRITIFLSFTDLSGNDISGIIGSITIYLLWSRDQSSWQSLSMIAQNVDMYYVDIPKQDGTDDYRFNDGAGQFYWYVLMQDQTYDSVEYYSADYPNTDIIYFGLAGSETSIVNQPLQENVSDNLPIFLEIPLAIVQELFDPLGNPFLKISMIVIFAILIFVWSTGGRGFMFLETLFRRK